MTPKIRLLLLTVFAILAAATSGALQASRVRIAEDIAVAERARHEALRFVDGLRQSTDELTKLARTYAATGDERFVDYYRWEHAVRAGKVGRPVDWWRVYWDLVIAGQDHPRPDTDPLSVVDLAAPLGFTDAERELLLGVIEAAAELEKVEEQAIEFRAGVYEERDGREYVVQAPDPDVALALLFDPPYLEPRAGCLNALDILQGLVTTRSDDEIAALRGQLAARRTPALVLGALAGLCGLLILGTASAVGRARPAGGQG